MKKFNFIKYIFILFVILLIGYSIYYIKGQEKEQEDIVEVEKKEVEEKTKITTLRLAAVNIDTINPLLSHNQNIQDISKLIYEPMLTLTDKFEVDKSLAKEWISLNDTTYVIVLKEGIKFQNDEELTATDVKYTIEQIKEIGDNSIFYPNVEHIESAEILSIYTIKINLDKPIPFFEYNLIFPIMSSKYFNLESMIDNEKSANPPGTGKYVVENISPTEIELKKNESWWGFSENKDLSLQTILIKLYSSMGEVYNAFKLGNLDLITTQSLNYEEYIGTIGYKTAEYPGREHVYLALNCTSGVLKHQEVRQAINNAIDKSNIIANVYGNKYYVADFPINTTNYLYNIEKVSSNYNTNKTRELLEEAGWEFTSGIWTKLEDYNIERTKLNFVVCNDYNDRIKIAEIIKKQLEECGIEINLIEVNTNQYNKYLENKKYDIILTGKLSGIGPDLSTYISEGNLSDFKDREIDSMYENLCNITDDESKTVTEYQKIIKLIEERRPFVSLYFNRNTVIYTEDLYGKISPNYYNIFYNIEEWVREK